jgi:uncharacterized membrane protein
MKQYLLGGLVGALVLTVNMVPAPAYAFHCPALVKECRTTVDKAASKAGTDQSMIAQARQDCDDAEALHKAGKHKESVQKAGEGITMAGKAVK